MSLNLDNKIFKSVSNSESGEVSDETIFRYFQNKNTIKAEYSGGEILIGQILGKWINDTQIDFYYHHINKSNELKAGKCLSTLSIMEDGRLKFEEQWQWLSGDKQKGKSEIIEIKDN
jgi:hypothetical protein